MARAKWSKESLISELQRLNSEGADLRAKSMIKSNTALYSASTRYFDSYQDALEVAGLAYRSKNIKWTKELVIEKLKELEANGEDFNSSLIQKNHPKLFHACRKYFKNYPDALEVAGIVPKSRNVKWTKELVISELQKMYSEGEKMNSYAIQRSHSNLYGASCRHFEDYEEALKVAGIVNEKTQREWSPEIVLKEIQALEDKTATNAISNYSTLFSAAHRIFSSWEKAVEKAGFNYSEIRSDVSSSIRAGFKFEKLTEELLSELGFELAHQDSTIEGCRFDSLYTTPEGERATIDAKLGRYTHNVSHNVKQKEKYLKHCERVVYIYLLGESLIENLENNVFNMSFYFFLDMLPEGPKKSELAQRAEEIKEIVYQS